jgi:hypothetical protein
MRKSIGVPLSAGKIDLSEKSEEILCLRYAIRKTENR